MTKSLLACATTACAILTASVAPALAQSADQPTPAPASNAMTQPTMAGALAANPNPVSFDAGPLGKVYASGVISGFGQWQTHPNQGDRYGVGDLSNAQAIVQTTEGLLQFYVQAGVYSIPALGTPYIQASKAVDDYFGVAPVIYAKVAPTDSFSAQIGKLPTLIGAEYTFTFENMNIDRGLLWNQENAINKGVQVNYTAGPLAASAAVTDGFYSDVYNWVTGSLTYTVNPANSVTLVGGGNIDQTTRSNLATPLFQNNSAIYNLIYTYSSDPWTVTPYLQYTDVPKNTDIGIVKGASTYGAAVLVKYAVPQIEGVSVPFRLEYIGSSGNTTDRAPNLLYGPGSHAWSVTLSPTYQKGILFGRAEASYVQAGETAAGAAFGRNGSENAQFRFALEGGFLF